MSPPTRVGISGTTLSVDLPESTVGDPPVPFVLAPDRPDARSGTVRIGGERFRYVLTPDPGDPDSGRIVIEGHALPFALDMGDTARKGRGRGGPDPLVRAHMPGLLVKLAVAAGDAVEPGTLLAVLEAMKMQNEIRSRVRGTVRTVHAAAGASLEGGSPLVTIDPA